jgi:uncharacterized protein (DUF1800 family)
VKLPRRKFLTAGAGGIALLATTGCDQLPRELKELLAIANPQKQGPFQAPGENAIDPIIHAFNRAGFGPRPGDYQRIRRLAASPAAAAAAYLEQQLHPESIPDDDAQYAARRFETLQEPLGELFEYQPDLLHSQLMRATLTLAVLSQRQLFEVMAQFWSDHFNIDPSKGDCKWLKVVDDREVIRQHALGRFSDLLRASALSPAMLWYLDGRVNRRTSPTDKPNENYARELLELHTLGVHGGYTQQDVMEVARCLTGWTVRSTVNPPYFQLGKVEFNPDLHDFGSKTVLGETIPATDSALPKDVLQQRGRHELDRVLQIAVHHPATARHLSAKLCRHFISDDPPAGAIAHVSRAFSKSEGDIRETLRALFQTEDFLRSRGNKFKRPFTFLASALRVANARTDCGLEMIDYLKRMGHAPFNYPTPEGYPDQAAPWMGTLLWRWNFAVALSQNKIEGTRVNLDELRSAAGGDEQLMAHLMGRKPTQAEAQAFAESGAGLALMLASPGFQRC